MVSILDEVGDVQMFKIDDLSVISRLMWGIHEVSEASPFRRFMTPSKRLISIEMTNGGPYGWISDEKGYRYEMVDPITQRFWPPTPPELWFVAQEAAKRCGYDNFFPDCCLINRYHPGNKLGMHTDRDEKDFTQPIVSISLGLPADFAYKLPGVGGMLETHRKKLTHGDVVVFGRSQRLMAHGITKVYSGMHDVTGPYRYNLTFRKAT